LRAPSRTGSRTVCLFACFWWYERVGPFGDGLRDLSLFAVIHVVGVLDHDRIHATGAARLTLDAGFEQVQVLRSSNISLRAEEGEERTADARDGRIWPPDPEKISATWLGNKRLHLLFG
jgi:hypothetical protein